MAISSKDLESLWQCYKVEAVPAGISVNQFFESNGVPYYGKQSLRAVLRTLIKIYTFAPKFKFGTK